MYSKDKKGFIRLILLIIIAILVLSYFGIKLRDIANSEAGSDNWTFIKEVGLKVWTAILDFWGKYLEPSASYLWNDVFLKYIWSNVVENLDKIRT